MRDKKIRISRSHVIPVILDGGLNENVNSIELRGGELIGGYNYQLATGTQGGYQSIAGYERFDGKSKPSLTLATDASHSAQDTVRAAISEVPGIGQVLGVHIFNGKIYAFRNDNSGTRARMFVSTNTGWSEINTDSDHLAANGSYRFVNYNFLATTAGFKMFWVDGKNKTRSYDGTTVVTLANSGMGSNDKPTVLIAHNDRLWLAYPGGSLQCSVAGDPANWGTGSIEFGMGFEITNLLTSVGNTLIVFCNEAIRTITGYDGSTFQVASFSNFSGAFPKTAHRIFGTAIFMDDRGVTNMEAVQEYGNFRANSLSQKIQRTLNSNKTSITCAIVSRDLNQYRLFFSNGGALYFSFLGPKLRGVTYISFIKPVLSATEGEDTNGNAMMYFTSTDGYVYQMDSGTSFDGEAISTSLSTSYYHYKSPRNWKRFKEITFEIASVSNLDIGIRALFDYQSGYVPKGEEDSFSVLGAGARWGDGVWGTMTYSGSENTNRIKYPEKGLGSNMSISIKTSEKYKRQHTIQNFTTDFQIAGRQL